jgi:hypothetical protein
VATGLGSPARATPTPPPRLIASGLVGSAQSAALLEGTGRGTLHPAVATSAATAAANAGEGRTRGRGKIGRLGIFIILSSQSAMAGSSRLHGR